MKRFALSFLVPLLSAACGSSLAGPSPAAVQPAVNALALTLQLFSAGESSKGWGSPTTVTIRAGTGGAAAGTIESAKLKIVTAQGETLAEASLDSRFGTPPDGVLSANTMVQKLTWSVESGYGARLDVTLTVRFPSGELRTVSFSHSYPLSRQ